MRLTFLIAAGIATAGVAACSKPGSPVAAKSSREIVLPTTPRSDAAVVSDLEAGRPATLKQPAQHSMAATLARTRSEPSIAPVQVPASASAGTESRSLELMAVPAPAAVPAAQDATTTPTPTPAESSEGWQAGTYHGHHVDMGGGSGGGSGPHGPAIILRGGLGGTDDKCDLRPRMWRGGIA